MPFLPAYSGPADRYTENYTYDALGRHTGTSYGEGTGDAKVERFTYDPAGNRTTKVVETTVLSVADAPAVMPGTPLVFRVTRSGDLSSSTQTVGVLAQAIEGASSGDFSQPTPTTLTFGSGVDHIDVSVPTTAGAPPVTAKVIGLRLSNATNGAAIARALGVGSIVGAVPHFEVSIANATLDENAPGAAMVFTITRVGTAQLEHAVSYRTVNGTALAGQDYTSTTGTLTFAPGTGNATQTVSVPLINDDRAEGTETFTLRIENPTNNATIPVAFESATANVQSEDAAGEFAIADASQTEGTPQSLRYAAVSITRTGGATSSHEIKYRTADGTATVAGNDYLPVTQSIVIPAGPVGQVFDLQLPISGDANKFESTETFTVEVFDKGHATFTDDIANVSITDDEAAFAIGDASVQEGTVAQPGELKIPFTRVAGAENTAVYVHLSAVGGTATSGTDYTALNPLATYYIEPGPLSQVYELAVPIIKGDLVSETDETIEIQVDFETGGDVHTSSDNVLTATILDDDVPLPGEFTISDAEVTENDEPGSVTAQVKIKRTGGGSAGHIFTYHTADGTAFADWVSDGVTGSDYTAIPSTTVEIPSGPIDQEVIVNVTVKGDNYEEEREYFRVVFDDLDGASLSPAGGPFADFEGWVYIDDNDPVVTYTIGDPLPHTEGDSGTSIVRIPVTRTNDSREPTGMTWRTVAGTASAGSDYTEVTNGWLLFPVGPVNQTLYIEVEIKNDTILEPSEQFQVEITSFGHGVGRPARTRSRRSPSSTTTSRRAAPSPSTTLL